MVVPRARLATAFWCLWALGCGDKSDAPVAREGAAEHDTNERPGDGDGDGGSHDGGDNDGGETSDGGDTGDAGDGGSDIPDPDPTDQQVCYPGAAGDYSACLPLVEWSPDWGADYAYPTPIDGRYATPVRFVDLDSPESDATLAIAPNFTLEEVMQSWKGRFGVYQVHTVEYLQAIRDDIGGPLTINSGYRNVTYNAGVGGASSSRHMWGDAADMASSSASLDELSDVCASLGAGYIGMYDTHVHCDWRDDALDPAFYDQAAASAQLSQRADGQWVALVPHFDEGTPRHRWVAHDARGSTLATGSAPQFRPPADTATLSVVVGGWLRLETALP